MFEDLGGLGSLLKQAKEMGGRMQGLSQELRGRRVTGSSGGGMVEVEVNGLMEVVRCRIDPSLVAQQDRELLEDLIASAVNQALTKAKQLHSEAMRSLAGGFSFPGLEQAIGKLLGGAPAGPDADEPPKP